MDPDGEAAWAEGVLERNGREQLWWDEYEQQILRELEGLEEGVDEGATQRLQWRHLVLLLLGRWKSARMLRLHRQYMNTL
jgi:hypothetical protein